MSEHATIGELIDLATTRVDQATWRIAHFQFIDADDALGTIAARAAAIMAASDLAKAIYGPLRLDAAEQLDPMRHRGPRPPLQRTEIFTAMRLWLPIAAEPTLTAPGGTAGPTITAQHFHTAAMQLRAAHDLLDTHRTSNAAATSVVNLDERDLGTTLALVSQLAAEHHLYARAVQAGVPQEVLDAALPLAQSAALQLATKDLLSLLPPPVDRLTTARAAGTIRTDTRAHEWGDRVERVRWRFARLASEGLLGAPTMSRLAHTALMNDHLAGGGRGREWEAIVEQMSQWESSMPSDPGIKADHRQLRGIAQAALAEPSSPATEDLMAQAHLSALDVAAITTLANLITPTMDRWTPGRPTPLGQARVRLPPFTASRSTEVPLEWPTSSPPALSL